MAFWRAARRSRTLGAAVKRSATIEGKPSRRELRSRSMAKQRARARLRGSASRRRVCGLRTGGERTGREHESTRRFDDTHGHKAAHGRCGLGAPARGGWSERVDPARELWAAGKAAGSAARAEESAPRSELSVCARKACGRRGPPSEERPCHQSRASQRRARDELSAPMQAVGRRSRARRRARRGASGAFLWVGRQLPGHPAAAPTRLSRSLPSARCPMQGGCAGKGGADSAVRCVSTP